jgi:predicted transcriptional regulator
LRTPTSLSSTRTPSSWPRSASRRVKGQEREFAKKAAEYGDREAQRALATQRKELEKAQSRLRELDALFRKLVRRYTVIQELTYENLHEIIDRIHIHATDKEAKTRRIEIFYSFVGQV